jgi:hypothetical protein
VANINQQKIWRKGKMKTLLAIVIGLAIIAGVFHSTTHEDNEMNEVDKVAYQSAAYQDGLYLGRLTAKDGNFPRIIGGRWRADKDRALFSAGYEHGYATIIAASVNAAHAGSAAFQDGLFLGALERKRGEQSTPSTGRWASTRDQELFEEGYRHAYSKVRIQTAASNAVR